MVYLLTSQDTARLRYVTDVIFGLWLDIPLSIVTESSQIPEGAQFITYGGSDANGLSIYAEGLLAESVIREDLPVIADTESVPQVFISDTPESFDVPFDIFSGVFYCLSRYEEFQIKKRDKHHRYSASDSPFQNWIDIPYVDRWIRHLEVELNSRGVSTNIDRSLKWRNTMDVDIAFAYLGRGLTRNTGSIFRDIKNVDLYRLKERASVWSGGKEDPFDTYSTFFSVLADENLIFIPAGQKSQFDKNLDPVNAQMQELITSLSDKTIIGLHPSYESLKNQGMILEEKKRLESVTNSSIDRSRQHFLRMILPDTYRYLLDLGINSEYSMGYHDRIGFRAGTAFSFPYYDLEKEEKTDLMIYPLIAMDSAMKNYMKLTPSEAVESIRKLVDSMKNSGGWLTTVWHNHSLSEDEEWKGWKAVYLSIESTVRHAG